MVVLLAVMLVKLKAVKMVGLRVYLMVGWLAVRWVVKSVEKKENRLVESRDNTMDELRAVN